MDKYLTVIAVDWSFLSYYAGSTHSQRHRESELDALDYFYLVFFCFGYTQSEDWVFCILVKRHENVRDASMRTHLVYTRAFWHIRRCFSVRYVCLINLIDIKVFGIIQK
jgi:hypothetical protein